MTDKLVAVTDALIARLETAKPTYGIHDVWYGEEALIPRTPALSVTPSSKARELTETGMMAMNRFSIAVVIYHSRLDDPQVTRRECDILAEEIEQFIHEDRRLGGLLIHSHIESVEPGFAARGKVTLRATRLSWTGLTKTRI